MSNTNNTIETAEETTASAKRNKVTAAPARGTVVDAAELQDNLLNAITPRLAEIHTALSSVNDDMVALADSTHAMQDHLEVLARRSTRATILAAVSSVLGISGVVVGFMGRRSALRQVADLNDRISALESQMTAEEEI